ncbi:MAG: hypothetical protein FJX68_17930 [Alphaproteobacteria bacterium]|nr:hypothetical protein [Alphaproteobacteria bacterium]
MSRRSATHGWWLPFLLALAIQSAALARADWSIAAGGLFDADAYMRLMRVQQLHDTGAWYDSLFRRSNAPFGEVLHWTRPFDVLLLAGGLALTPLWEFPTALHVWGVLVSPLLLLTAIPALYWAAQPLLPAGARLHLALMYLFQLGIAADFAAGRADHHGLIALSHILLLGIGLRLVAGPPDGRIALAGGLLVAWCLWLSIETLVAVALLLSALGLLWLRNGQPFARLAVQLNLAATLAIAAILPLERSPAALLAAEYDRISLVHLLCFALQSAFWLVAAQAVCGRWPSRAVWAVAGGGAVLLTMALAYPKFFLGPAAEIDAEVYRIWFKGVAEVTSPLVGHDPVRVAQRLLVYFGVPAVGAFLLFR